jgi:hypothetical protein
MRKVAGLGKIVVGQQPAWYLAGQKRPADNGTGKNAHFQSEQSHNKYLVQNLSWSRKTLTLLPVYGPREPEGDAYPE